MALFSNTGETGSKDAHGRYDFLAGIGCLESFSPDGDPFDSLYRYHCEKQDWLFGHFGYGLKDNTGRLASKHPDRIGFPVISFFRPRYVLTCTGGNTELWYLPDYESSDSIDRLVHDLKSGMFAQDNHHESIQLIARTSKEQYLEKVNAFLQHIRRGDIYEANYCMEFFAENSVIDPAATFLKLNAISPMPASGYYHASGLHLLCASPERFLTKRGSTIVSQPIKGTVRRGKDAEEDYALKTGLAESTKERAENVMIADLVRNDLSRTAKRGTVEVEELFGIKTYPRIHQLVTTIRAEMAPDKKWTDVIRYSFPMGSMTGAPKMRAMELIEALEDMSRGLYSGSIGYITPEADFDLNVVIRSIQFNSATGYLSAMAGSALTVNCNPEAEYEECLLKAATMKKALD